MPAASETLSAHEQRLAERLPAFDLLDEAELLSTLCSQGVRKPLVSSTRAGPFDNL